MHAIYQQVYEDVPFGKLALLARGLQNTERYDDGRLTASQLSAEDFEAAGAEESYSEGVIDHLRAVRGTAMAALVRDRLAAPGEPAEAGNGERLRKVSLRASDMRVDVSAIARAQGGGGHRAAAGFSTSMPWDELIAFLREQLAAQLASLPRRVSRRAAGDGLLLCDKPAGITSHDVVAQTRRRLGRGIKVGHAGTLDPFATGSADRAGRPRDARSALRDGASQALRGDGAVRRDLDDRRSRG